MAVRAIIILFLSFTFISADDYEKSLKCQAKLLANPELVDAIDKSCENATCDFKCAITELGWLNKNSELIKDEAKLAANLASAQRINLDTARLYAKGFFTADCPRLLANVEDCKSYQYFARCATNAGCDFAEDSRLENITKYTDVEYWIERENHDEQIQREQEQLISAEGSALKEEFIKCLANDLAEDSAFVEALDKCTNTTCDFKCALTYGGWIKKGSRLIKDEITLANSLRSSSIRGLQTARKYAKGFFKADCNGLIAHNVNDCGSYRSFYSCALIAGCEFARGSTNFTGYSEHHYWTARFQPMMSHSSKANKSSSNP